MGPDSILSYSTSTSASLTPELFYNPDSGAAGVQLSARRFIRTRQCPRGDHELTGTVQLDFKHRQVSGKARALKQFYMRDAEDTSAPFLQAAVDFNSAAPEPFTAALEARQLRELSSGAVVDLAAGARLDVMGSQVRLSCAGALLWQQQQQQLAPVAAACAVACGTLCQHAWMWWDRR
jgi:hypothetical protein